MNRTISVVVICYNQRDLVQEAVASVLGQTRVDAIPEIVVVDDGSSDDSFAVLQALAAREPKVKAFTQPNSGGCSAPRNTGIPHATGDYVAFLDGDDLWMPEKIEAMLAAIERAPDAGLFLSDFLEFDQDGRTQVLRPCRYTAGEPNQFGRFFAFGGPIPPSCAVVKREAFAAVGLFDPTMRFNEDAEFWLRVASAFPVQHVPGVLVAKRVWFGSLGSGKFRRENIAFLEEITRRALAAHPELAAMLPEREARVAVKIALLHMENGDRREAARALLRAIRARPAAAKPWIYLLTLLLPGSPARAIDTLKGMFRRASPAHRNKPGIPTGLAGSSYPPARSG